MFKWINKQGVENDSGFVVQFTGRFSAELRYKGRVLKIEIESGSCGGQPAICFNKSEFQRWGSDKSQQDEALQIFKDALIFQGLVPIAD